MAVDPETGPQSKPALTDTFHLYGLFAVLAGLFAIVVLVLYLVNGKGYSANEVTAVMGAVTSSIVAIVSAYFGISVAATGQAKAKDSADKALVAQKDSADKAMVAQKDSADKALAAGLAASPESAGVQTLMTSLTQAFGK